MRLFNKKSSGDFAEKVALKYLQSQNLKKITSNYHCKYGEIDLIMQDEDVLVFIEVRYRKNSHYGSAVETVTQKKLKKIKKTIKHYIMTNNLDYIPCRIDVIGLEESLTKPKISWIRNAGANN